MEHSAWWYLEIFGSDGGFRELIMQIYHIVIMLAGPVWRHSDQSHDRAH
jgi:hypothetical protein